MTDKFLFIFAILYIYLITNKLLKMKNENRTTNTENRTTNTEDNINFKIPEHYLNPIQLAKLCGFSVRTLYRKFKEYDIETDGKLISPQHIKEILIKFKMKKIEK